MQESSKGERIDSKAKVLDQRFTENKRSRDKSQTPIDKVKRVALLRHLGLELF
jgi:hypothetical protein